jgi:membrane-bound ClpP family serine protease
MNSQKPVKETLIDYSAAIALFVFGLVLISLAFYVGVGFVALAGLLSILASVVCAILMRFFHL